MNTTTKITFALFTVLSLGALAGCEAPRSIEEMSEEAELDVAEPVGEAEQALNDEVTPPLLTDGTLYRIQIMMPTETAEDPDPKCLDLPHKSVGLGAPLVRRTCSSQQLSNNENTQAFYFTRVQVTGHPEITNRYYMKPAHQGSNLCIYSAGPSFENGGNVVVGQCSSADSKQLNLRAYTGGTQAAPWDNFATLSFQHSQRCLSVPGSWEGEFVAITQYGTTSTAYCVGLYNNQKLRILTQ